MKNNIVGWFEIPVTNMERAIKFYETIFKIQLSRNKIEDLDMAWFPWVDNGAGAGGSLVCQPEYYQPSIDGTLVYLSSQTGDLADELSRVEAAGGTIVMEKKLITEEIGYMALILDSEGNKIALHSLK